MKKQTAWLAAAGLLLLADASRAEDPPKPAAARGEDDGVAKARGDDSSKTLDERQDDRTRSKRRIRVLRREHEIASFYGSRQAPRAPYFGYHVPAGLAEGPYPIAAYYRQRQTRDAFGRLSVGTGTKAPALRSSGLAGYYRRELGSHGELFLLAPTFLAPVGPLSEAFHQTRQ